jgi:hypothetical protein
MKTYYLLFLALLLTACGPAPKSSAPRDGKVSIKFLKEMVVDENLSISVLCIDGVKYLKTPEGGIAPKYQAWEDADATVEECE